MSASEQRDERRRFDRSEGIPLRRRHGQLVRMLMDRRQPNPEGFDIAAALEIYFDRFPSREAQLVLLRSWLYAVERDELASARDYRRTIEHAIEVMSTAPNVGTAIAMLQRQIQQGQ